jgi:hypothetical protein
MGQLEGTISHCHGMGDGARTAPFLGCLFEDKKFELLLGLSEGELIV